MFALIGDVLFVQVERYECKRWKTINKWRRRKSSCVQWWSHCRRSCRLWLVSNTPDSPPDYISTRLLPIHKKYGHWPAVESVPIFCVSISSLLLVFYIICWVRLILWFKNGPCLIISGPVYICWSVFVCGGVCVFGDGNRFFLAVSESIHAHSTASLYFYR